MVAVLAWGCDPAASDCFRPRQPISLSLQTTYQNLQLANSYKACAPWSRMMRGGGVPAAIQR